LLFLINIPQGVCCLKGNQKTTVCYICQRGDSSANYGCTCGWIYNRYFRTVYRAMCPWKHIETLATWKCSKMAEEWKLKAAVQLTRAQIHFPLHVLKS